MLAFGLCAIGGAVTLLGHLVVGPQTAPRKVALPNIVGVEACPALSPGGRTLAYSARAIGNTSAWHVFTRGLGGGGASPIPLTSGAGSDLCPVWSPDGGSLAFARVTEGRLEYLIAPARNAPGVGTERKVAEFAAGEDMTGGSQPVSAVAWLPDGQSLAVMATAENQPDAIAIVSLASGAVRRITEPPADSTGDSSPAVSPDGSLLAFVRRLGPEENDIYVSDLKGGRLVRVTFDGRPIRGVAWAADGRDLVYAADRVRGWHIWRVPAYGGSPRELLLESKSANWPAIARGARPGRLAYTEAPATESIWLGALPAAGPRGQKTADAAPARPLLGSNGREVSPSWSPDGSRIADVSDQTGNEEIWVSDADGRNRIQLTRHQGPRLGRPRWSPDGRTIAYVTQGGGENAVYSVAADGRAGVNPVRLLAGNGSAEAATTRKGFYVIVTAGGVSWSRDGKSIYYQSRGGIWKADADGRNARQIAHRSGSDPEESADGKFVFFRSRRAIWRVPADGGDEEEVLTPEHTFLWTTLQPVKKGLYYLEWDAPERAQVVSFYDFAARKSNEVFRIKSAAPSPRTTFTISPDGRYILYPSADRDETSLAIVENFR
jgi:Tol biopolymer transport system component